MIGTHLDITARKQAEEALAHLNAELADEAATDALTNLATRRHFSESLENAVSLARRHGSPLALVSLDLDGLKQINDSTGHAAGDETLTSFAALLDSLCRGEDLPGRLGGDEFSLLLPGTNLSGALGLAKRVLAAVRSCEALERRGATVSGGVAQWSPGELPEDLLRRADEALYAAKRGGGDSVMVNGDPPQFNAAGRP
jgi:diguanylate cyclase (GGDEF)-like protein